MANTGRLSTHRLLRELLKEKSFCVSIIDVKNPFYAETTQPIDYKLFRYREFHSNSRKPNDSNEEWESTMSDIITALQTSPASQAKSRIIVTEVLSFSDYSATRILDVLGLLFDLDPGIVSGIAEERLNVLYIYPYPGRGESNSRSSIPLSQSITEA